MPLGRYTFPVTVIKIFMFKRSITAIAGVLIVSVTYSQKLISASDAVSLAVKNSKNISAASLSVKQQQQLLNSAINLPNPELFLEAPTGNFYTPSVTQSIEFPTVYGKQYQLQKQYIGLAEKEKALTEAEVKLQVNQLYLLLQYAEALQNQLYGQDTIYESISKSAGRQFDAGQIDYLQKTFAETQYGEIHNQYIQVRQNVNAFKNQLQYITALPDSIIADPLNIFTYSLSDFEASYDSAALLTNPSIQISKQTENIEQKNIELQKSKALPGLAFGYFNQGEKSTPVGNRFRFGLTVPLWFWQYKSNISAAKTALEVSQQKTGGLQQQLTVQLIQAKSELNANTQSLKYYQTSGNTKATQIITTAKRFLDNGQSDYINYLRNINDAYSIQLKYIEAIKNYNQSIITIQYLTGSL